MKAITNNKLKGFTLVELLVVIAIIGLLAAIGIPAILNAQKSSRNATRFKQLEAVRNAVTDYYTKYNTDITVGTVVHSGTGDTTNGYTSVTVGTGTKTTVVDADGYKYINLGNVTACSAPSVDKKVIFFVGKSVSTLTYNDSLIYCKEGGGEDILKFR